MTRDVLKELKITLGYEGAQSLPAVARSLSSISQFYYFYWLLENGGDGQWEDWLSELHEWIGNDGLTLRALTYGSDCELTLQVKVDNETKLRRAAEAARKLVEYLRKKGPPPERQLRNEITSADVVQFFPEVGGVNNSLRPRVIELLRFAIFGLSPVAQLT